MDNDPRERQDSEGTTRIAAGTKNGAPPSWGPWAQETLKELAKTFASEFASALRRPRPLELSPDVKKQAEEARARLDRVSRPVDETLEGQEPKRRDEIIRDRLAKADAESKRARRQIQNPEYSPRRTQEKKDEKDK